MRHNHDDQPFGRADEQAATSSLSTTARKGRSARQPYSLSMARSQGFMPQTSRKAMKPSSDFAFASRPLHGPKSSL